MDERLKTLDAIVAEVKQNEEWEVARMSILSTGIEIGEKKGIEIGQKKGILAMIRMGREFHLSMILFWNKYVKILIWIRSLRKDTLILLGNNYPYSSKDPGDHPCMMESRISLIFLYLCRMESSIPPADILKLLKLLLCLRT